MVNFEVSFRRDDPYLDCDIMRASDLSSIWGDVSVRVGDKYVTDGHPDVLHMFFSASLGYLPDLHSGLKRKYEFELDELVFEPRDSMLALHLAAKTPGLRGYTKKGEKHEVTIRDFSRDLINHAQDFIDFVIEKRPDLENEEQTKEFMDKLEAA